MKFDTSTVYFIEVLRCNTLPEAVSYIQKMYDKAYGVRAGTVDSTRFTPNEERLARCLMDRFRTELRPTVPGSMNAVFRKEIERFTGTRAPLSVCTGMTDFVFISNEPHEGFYVPYGSTI